MPETQYILGPDGEPYVPSKGKAFGSAQSFTDETLLTALRSVLHEDAKHRARNPYKTHPWVYAAVSAIADNLSQVSFLMWRETEEQQQERARTAHKHGYVKHLGNWIPNRGKRRMAIARHLDNTRRWYGKTNKALKPDFDHPLAAVFSNPNPHMNGADLWKLTDLFMSIFGKAHWLILGEEGAPWFPGDPVQFILPLHPDDISPWVDGRGVLSHWEFDVTKKSRGLGLGPEGTLHRFMPQEVVWFRNMDPEDPLNGVPHIGPAATSIYQDLLAQEHGASLLADGAVPDGFLIHKSEYPLEPKEKRKLIRQFHARHGGPRNRRKIALLDGGLEFAAEGMNMQDLEMEKLRGLNCSEILGVMRTNKTVIGLTEDLNHATSQVQDRNFWRLTTIPRIKVYEREIDRTLLFTEPDTVMAAFKLEDVEALQQDLTDKVENANKLTQQFIHMPPKVALDLVGLDVEEYEGDDIALVPPIVRPVGDVIETSENMLEMQTDPDAFSPDGEGLDDSQIEEDDKPLTDDQASHDNGRENSLPTTALARISRLAARRGLSSAAFRRKQRTRSRQTRDAYNQLIQTHMGPFGGAYKTHVFGLRKETLRNFDAIADQHKSITKQLELTPEEIEQILFDLRQAGIRINQRTMPLYEAMLEGMVEFTTAELGALFLFDIMSPEIQEFTDTKLILVRGVNNTIRNRLRSSIAAGLRNGEGVEGVRRRIRGVFNRAVTRNRELMIAATETAQMLSGARNIIFRQEGVTQHEWITAGDEHVRDTHVTLGQAGPQPVGFNFMQLLGGGGVLRYPSDIQGPAREVINCRCVNIPVG